jgi:hypothetical protein
MLLCWSLDVGLCSQPLQLLLGRVCSCILAKDCEKLHQTAELNHFLEHHCGAMQSSLLHSGGQQHPK